MRLLVLALLVLLAGLLAAVLTAAESAPDASPTTVVRIDLRAARQTIDGFGSSERVWADPHLSNAPVTEVPPAARAAILTALYRELGLTRVRPVLDQGVQPRRGSPFSYEGKLADAHIAYVKQARRFGLQTFFPGPVYIEPWMGEGDVDAYVDWAMAMLRHWREAGLEPPLYAPQNEPFINENFPPAWLHDVVVKLGARMRRAGFRTKLVVPDDVDPVEAYRRAVAILEDPEARQYVGAIAYHVYRSGDWDVRELARLRQLAMRHGLPLWMTEYSDRDYADWSGSLDWARKLHVLLTTGGVSAVDYLWGFFGDKYATDTLVSIDFDGGRYIHHVVTPVGWITAQYARFVRPGFTRVAATTPAKDVLATAYAGPRRLVLVASNLRSSAATLQVRVTGGALRGRVRATRSSASEGMRTLEPISQRAGTFSAQLPPRSVSTFVVSR